MFIIQKSVWDVTSPQPNKFAHFDLGSLTPFFNLGVWRFLGFLEPVDPSVEPSASGIRGSVFSAKITGMNCAVLRDVNENPEFFSSETLSLNHT